MPVSMILCGGVVRRSTPSMLMAPLVAGSMPEMTRSNVVLPAPFAPITATASPALTSMETPNNAWKPP